MAVQKAGPGDIDEVARLYDALCDYLARGANFPGWRKGLYPARETAEDAAAAGTLFVLRQNGALAGSVILNREAPAAYRQVRFGVDADDGDVVVVHTLAVHPAHMGKGVAKKLMAFAKAHAKAQGAKAVRLDVSVHNAPAIALYERCGYTCAGTVDLGLGIPGLVWFRLYELAL